MLPRRWQGPWKGVWWTLALAVLGLPASHQQQPQAPPLAPSQALPQAQSQALQAPQQNVEGEWWPSLLAVLGRGACVRECA